jgi:O-antigen/teichoic acid export membrane protein
LTALGASPNTGRESRTLHCRESVLSAITVVPTPTCGHLIDPHEPTISQPPAAINRGSIAFSRLRQLLGSAGRSGFWPFADQAIVSLGNFLTLVFVARGLPEKSEYGIFGLILEFIFYLNALQGSLVIYPLTVRGATSDDERVRRLATVSLLLTLLLCMPVALLAFGAATFLHSVMLGLAGALALVAWQLQEVTRNALRSRFRFADAAVGDAIRYLGTAAVVWILWRSGRVTLPGVFLVIAASSVVAIVVQAIQVGLTRVAARDLIELAREFWDAGRWLLFGSASAILVSICGVWTLSWFHGNAPVGEFYAVANFTKPINPIIITFATLVTQHVAKALAEHGMLAAKSAALRLSAGALAMTLPYLLAVILMPGLAIRFLYGADSHFRTAAGEMALRIFALGFTLFLLMSLIGSFLNGIGRTRDSFYAQIVNSVATVAIALPLTITHGLLGQIIGGAIAAAIQCCSMIYLFRRVR